MVWLLLNCLVRWVGSSVFQRAKAVHLSSVSVLVHSDPSSTRHACAPRSRFGGLVLQAGAAGARAGPGQGSDYDLCLLIVISSVVGDTGKTPAQLTSSRPALK